MNYRNAAKCADRYYIKSEFDKNFMNLLLDYLQIINERLGPRT